MDFIVLFADHRGKYRRCEVGDIPQKLNWVEKRATCTVAQIFNELCEGIEADVSAINSARKLTEEEIFRADMNGLGNAIVVGQPKVVPRARAIVGISGESIAVRQEWNGGEKWTFTVGLNDEGRCILRDENQNEMEQWQLRKRALEGLFFS